MASGIRRRDHRPAQNPGAATPVPERGGRHRDRFRRDQHLEPFTVQAVWLVGTLAGLLICAPRLGRGPAQ
jgi:hypothetical protein